MVRGGNAVGYADTETVVGWGGEPGVRLRAVVGGVPWTGRLGVGFVPLAFRRVRLRACVLLTLRHAVSSDE